MQDARRAVRGARRIALCASLATTCGPSTRADAAPVPAEAAAMAPIRSTFIDIDGKAIDAFTITGGVR